MVSSMTITAHNSLCSNSCISSTHRPGSDATVGKRCMKKQKKRTHNDLSTEMHSNEGESVSTYHHRPKAEAFDNTVDVVKLLLALTDQAPNVRHLRVLHTFSSVTSLAFFIQQGVEVVDEFRQHDGVMTVMVK